MTKVTLVNFILMCFKETRMTLWFSTVKYLISNLFVNSFMSPSLSVNNALVKTFWYTLVHYCDIFLLWRKKKNILYTKHINNIHKKREDKPPPLFSKEIFLPTYPISCYSSCLLSISRPTQECHTKKCFSHGVKATNVWHFDSSKLADIMLCYEDIA